MLQIRQFCFSWPFWCEAGLTKKRAVEGGRGMFFEGAGPQTLSRAANAISVRYTFRCINHADSEVAKWPVCPTCEALHGSQPP